MSDVSSALTPNARPVWPSRAWVAVLVLAVVLASLLLPPFFIERDALQYRLMMFAPAVGAIGVCTWWMRLSGVDRPTRLGVLACFLVPLFVFVVELMVQGVVPMAPGVFGVPFVLTLWVGWSAVCRPFDAGVRRVGVYAAVLIGWSIFGLVRFEQTDASMVPNLTWRWNPRPEDAFAAMKDQRGKIEASASPIVVKPGDWAEFRGPNRDNKLTGVGLDAKRFAEANEVWKVPIGPGWGSFAVVGDRLFTLEQQGDNEAVVCLDAASGKLVWEHVYRAKFTDANAGVGPRSTPTVCDGRVYSTGATGKLTCLEASTGKEVWTKDYEVDAEGVRPRTNWGYASSPLAIHGRVIVFTGGGKKGKSTTAFDATNGRLVWQAGNGWHGYSSAQVVTFSGVEQVLMASNYGLESFDPKTGAPLWEHVWVQSDGNRTTQPAILGDGELLLGTGVGFLATRRLKVTKTEGGWDVQKVWESRRLSPYFNDGVVHNGHYYGFSGERFHCVDLANGEEKWSAGARYGNGQVLLLADQGLLVVSQAKRSLDDVGSVFLLETNPDDHTELSSFPSIKGKTWNHPVIAHGRLYIRNGVEAACYELPVK